jgi:hypothetical protein
LSADFRPKTLFLEKFQEKSLFSNGYCEPNLAMLCLRGIGVFELDFCIFLRFCFEPRERQETITRASPCFYWLFQILAGDF